MKQALDASNEVQAELEVTIITSNYDYYRYYKGIRAQFPGSISEEGNGGDSFEEESGGEVGSNPFGDEPILFPKTLEGGVGIFAAYRVSTRSFDLRELFQSE